VSTELVHAELVGFVVGAFYDVYIYYGYGLAESVYAGALSYELELRRHQVVRELAVAVKYKDRVVAWQRLDMVVDGKLVVELKATEKLPPCAARQVLNYLRATPFEVGLLLHFGPKPKFERFVDSAEKSFAVIRGNSRHPRLNG
jgi:GxxExxY protein